LTQTPKLRVTKIKGFTVFALFAQKFTNPNANANLNPGILTLNLTFQNSK